MPCNVDQRKKHAGIAVHITTVGTSHAAEWAPDIFLLSERISVLKVAQGRHLSSEAY